MNITIKKGKDETLFQIPVLEGSFWKEGSEANMPNMDGALNMIGAKTMSENIQIWHNSLRHPDSGEKKI